MLLRKRDDGAISVISAVVFACLLMALAALVVDVGQMYDERRQLQNGSDESATAIAHKFAEQKFSLVGIDPVAIARSQSSKNAVDGVADVLSVKIVRNGSTVFSSGNTTSTGSVYDCQPTNLTNYVEVRNKTESGGLKYFFSPGEATISSCARASWEGLGGAATIPITMSICEWDKATNNGSLYASPPPYPPNPATSLEQIVSLQNSNGTGCNRGPANQFVPGGFGWLDGDKCIVEAEAGDWMPGSSGSSELSPCRAFLVSHIGEVVYIPVHDEVTGTGSNASYHIAGYAAFVLNGMYLPGLNSPSWLTSRGKKDCNDLINADVPVSHKWEVSSSTDPFLVKATVNSGAETDSLRVSVSQTITGSKGKEVFEYSYDGVVSTSNTHTFSSPGAHVVSVKVTDASGKSQTVIVPVVLGKPKASSNDQGQCLFGMFTEALSPVGSGSGGPNYGATLVRLVL